MPIRRSRRPALTPNRTRIPRPDKRAVTGSNLPRNRLSALRRERVAELRRALRKRNAGYRRGLQRLLSRSAFKRAAAIIAEAKREWFPASFTACGHADRWDARRDAARAGLRRKLARAVPRYRDIRGRQRGHQRELEKLLARWRAPIPPLVGVLAPDDPPDATVFRPPFPLVDSHAWRDQDEHIQITDRSFVLPETGQLIVDADFDNDEDTAFSDGLLGLLYPNSAGVVASCGVAYTVPRTGPLRVTAELKNFYNHTTMSLRDNWGFSSGTLYCDYYLFAAVLRPSRESLGYQLLFEKALTSDGDDTSGVMPDIDQEAPLALDVTTDDSFAAGEPVWVMVGSAVGVYSMLDDMHSHVRTLLWWQVNRITVSPAS